MRPPSRRRVTRSASMLLLVVWVSCTATPPQAPAPLPNGAPTVSVVFDGPRTCTPRPGIPCTLDVLAQASDPDGDPLTYHWSGCATGTLARAVCTVAGPGPVVASVQVSDGRGLTATASATGEGLALPNAPPEVEVEFVHAASCVPLPNRPCLVDLVVNAVDPDGDPLTYRWSGCASGTRREAACRVERPEPVAATVEVSDGQGHTVSGSLTVTGVNNPPGVHVGYVTMRSSSLFEVLGNVVDPDEGLLCGAQYCVSAAASGGCSVSRFTCTCLAGLELDIVRSSTSGTCSVTLTLRDGWGRLGTPSLLFDLANPRVPNW